jgi:hypothetical protein
VIIIYSFLFSFEFYFIFSLIGDYLDKTDFALSLFYSKQALKALKKMRKEEAEQGQRSVGSNSLYSTGFFDCFFCSFVLLFVVLVKNETSPLCLIMVYGRFRWIEFK